MERLTEWDEYGNADIIELSDMMPEIYAELSFSETNALTDGLNRLAAYEDTGLEPEEINTMLTPPNTPLTLEELREIAKGKPVVVWMVHRDEGGQDYGEWAMFVSEENMFICDGELAGVKKYGTAFVAYRRKPEEGKPCIS